MWTQDLHQSFFLHAVLKRLLPTQQAGQVVDTRKTSFSVEVVVLGLFGLRFGKQGKLGEMVSTVVEVHSRKELCMKHKMDLGKA